MSNGNLFLVSAIATVIAVALLPVLSRFGLPAPSII